ncbi:MAG: sensor domain-containing diguanylate cyclase [Pseudomonadales bacterium]|nr:sensor domain-containing diguanylate cyclase [Pseudomonadales bacterium]
MSKMPTPLLTKQLDDRVQERLEAVLNGMPVAVSWAGLKDQKLMFVNRKFREMFGYELSEHPTVTQWIQQVYPDPQQVKRALDMWAPHFETTAIVPFEIPQVEVDVLCKDGDVKTTLLSGMILPSEGWALAIYSDITDRKKAEQQIQQQALEDPLTGLHNRRAFDESLDSSLSQARQNQSSMALLMLDLDEFKALNDALGHDQGDRILQIVSERIRHGVRDEDLVCRLGGDEFSVIIPNLDTEQAAEEVAERIIAEVRKPMTLEGRSHLLNLSIGIGIFPNDAADGENLYRFADHALYRAKQNGRGRWSR